MDYSESSLVGVRAFESHLSHQKPFLSFNFKLSFISTGSFYKGFSRFLTYFRYVGYPTRSKATGRELILVGVHAFESRSSH